MKLKEYKEWLKQNSNCEEEQAYNIAKLIVDWHTVGLQYDEMDIEVYPRHILARKDESDKLERLEFDLVIQLKWTTKVHSIDGRSYSRQYERLIGVEFKEYDMRKVVLQAMRRRDFVDYMYIATRNITVDYIDLFYLADFSIGWIIYDADGFVKMLIPSRIKHGQSVTELIKSLAERAVRETIREMKLDVFLGD